MEQFPVTSGLPPCERQVRNVGSTLAHDGATNASKMRATSVILVTLHGLITTDPLFKSDRSDAWI
jgi:hypothetical protein